MKKFILTLAVTLCLALGISSIATAGDDGKLRTIGEIVTVDSAQQVLTIKDQNGKDMAFKITPETDLEFEDNGMLSWDDDATMKDLKTGQWVKVKYHGTGDIKAAKDIKIYKVKER